MGYITAIAAIIKAIPEIIKLLTTLFSEWRKRQAEKDWDDFEDRFKKGVEGEK
jgi:hypothetical protein